MAMLSIMGLAASQLHSQMENRLWRLIKSELPKVKERYLALHEQYAEGLISRQEFLNGWVIWLDQNNHGDEAVEVASRMASCLDDLAKQCEFICKSFNPALWGAYCKNDCDAQELLNTLHNHLEMCGRVE